MRTVAIIQARVGSTRLPSKIMMDLMGKTVLEHVYQRVVCSKKIDDIVIATTMEDADDVVETLCIQKKMKCFRGSMEDVLERYYLAAKGEKADCIVRITSDCPLIDPDIIDEIIMLFHENKCSLATNAGPDLSKRTFPRGLDVEVFSFDTLEEACNNATHAYEREHVTPYIYENKRDICYYMALEDHSNFRWTLDTQEDFKLISEIYRNVYNESKQFKYSDVLEVLRINPELHLINSHIEQKKIK